MAEQPGCNERAPLLRAADGEPERTHDERAAPTPAVSVVRAVLLLYLLVMFFYRDGLTFHRYSPVTNPGGNYLPKPPPRHCRRLRPTLQGPNCPVGSRIPDRLEWIVCAYTWPNDRCAVRISCR